MKDTPVPADGTTPPAKVVRDVPTLPVRQTDMKRKPRWLLRASFVLFVLIPVVLSTIYFALIASDRYAVEIKFAVRSPAGSAAPDVAGLLSGASGGATTIDSYMVTDFLESRDLVDKLEERLDLRAMFDNDNIDFLSRFDSTKPKEELVDYLAWRITAYFDTSSQIISVEVQAFTPEDAKRLASEILALSGDLVNDVSERARLDTVRSAEEEVRRNEILLREHRAKMAQFRETEQDLDPTRSAEAQAALLGNLERELSQKQTQMSTILEFLREDAPRVKFLESEIAALETQVALQRARLGTTAGSDNPVTLTQRISNYEELAVDLEFLQKAYVSSLASLEGARLEADRQQRYLASFVLPSLPEKALYPLRFLDIIMASVLALMVWSITVLAGYVVREHLP